MIALADLLRSEYAGELLDHWRRYPGFGLSGDGGAPTGPVLACSARNRPARTRYRGGTRHLDYASGVSARTDATDNYVRSGGRLSVAESPRSLRARTNYFRATYADGRNIFAPVVAELLQSSALADAARAVHGLPIVLPCLVYANVMLPGQELGVHTDVPEFRGANRGRYPMWLLVVMHHSGLFERWRIHLATAVLHLGDSSGGEFAHYPDGPAGKAVIEPTRHNQALVLDTDSDFHGVDRVGGDDSALAALRPGVTLHHQGDGWHLREGEGRVWSFGAAQLRYSVSWKAQCLSSRDELEAIERHDDDLEFSYVLAQLENALKERGRGIDTSDENTFARRLIDEFIPFPGRPDSSRDQLRQPTTSTANPSPGPSRR